MCMGRGSFSKSPQIIVRIKYAQKENNIKQICLMEEKEEDVY